MGGRGIILLPCWFSLNNSERVKPVTLEFFSIFPNIFVEKFLPNLASLTPPSLQIFGKNADGGISDFWLSGQSLIKENCHNSRASASIDKKLGPVTKLGKKNKKNTKKVEDDAISKIVASLLFLQFMVNSEQSRSRILDAQSVKYIFLLIVIFYLTKTENKTKRSLTKL